MERTWVTFILNTGKRRFKDVCNFSVSVYKFAFKSNEQQNNSLLRQENTEEKNKNKRKEYD